ncbi:myosin heavy chain, non-muscle-like [Uloborus diversus]|uniref:myosin heavy chain, non-muscle-like n=1 Tax=Uloborus diversus TaxID=327109 RepID=UPI00240A995B|nr:myosin heavy chain, non-muscle-like [Uloborus diversus]
MKRRRYQCCFSFISLLCFVLTDLVTGTSLMKRIREKQTVDNVVMKGLEMTSENWIEVPQPVQDVLMSIDDKLRSLDTFGYTLKLARLDFSLEQLVRRMENIETKLGSLETKFDVRMIKVEEVVVSKDIKEEFSNEHLNRRMESLNEKINNKAAYLDAKLDIKFERVLNKLELLERELHSTVGDILERLIRNEERHAMMESELAKKEEKLEEICMNMNDYHQLLKNELLTIITKNYEDHNLQLKSIDVLLKNNENKSEKALTDLQTTVSGTKDRMLTMLQDSHKKIDNLSESFNHGERSRSIDMCEVNTAVTQEQLENLTVVLQKALTVGETKFQELDSDVELYTKKVVNGIQELWKTSDELKLDLSNTLEQGSRTRDFVRREFQRLHEQIEPLPNLEPKISNISEDLDKKVVELSNTVDSSFSTLLVAQNTFIDSCRRIQEEETHIYDILQQIVYEMRNRSIADIHKISSELQTQSLQFNKSLANVLTTVLLTGNITTNAMNELLEQLRQRDQCIVLKMESFNYKTMESVCKQLSLDVETSRSDESESKYENEDISDDTMPDHSMLKNRQVYDKDSQQSDSFHVNDYDMDYQLSDAEYKEDT